MYTVKNPMRYYQGSGILQNLREYTKYLGSSCLVVISNNGFKRYGYLFEHLCDEGCDVNYYIYGSKSEIVDTSKDFIIGVGGGSIIDETKRIANNSNIPCVIIPTVLSSDAASNSIIVPKVYNDKDTMIIRSNRSPEMVLADTNILINSPLEYAISGIGDALATFYEAYYCSISTGYTMNHTDLPPFMISRAFSMLQSLLSNGKDSIDSMKQKIVSDSFEFIVYTILYESSVLSENCGIGIAHAFSLAYDEVFKENTILHGIKVAFGLLLNLTIVGGVSSFNCVKEYVNDIGLYSDFDILKIDSNNLMKISESISSNKLSKNVTGKHYSPVDIYNYLIKTNSKIKAKI